MLVTFDGSNVGYCAMASTSPVCGWMITTVQLLALVLATCFWHACSAAYCSAGTMVSRRSLPLTTGGLDRQVGGLSDVEDVRWVERRVLRHGHHLPGVRLDDHYRAIARLGLGDLFLARLLGRVLQRRDDGEPET